MGEAKRKRLQSGQAAEFCCVIELHTLAPVAAIDSKRIRELTGDDSLPDSKQVVLNAFQAKVGERSFHVGFCIGSEEGFSAIGIAVIERLMMEVPCDALHVVPIVHGDIAWDMVLRHLRNFTGQVLLFAFSDSDVYDAGTAEMHFSSAVCIYNNKGNLLKRLTSAQRRKIREQAATIFKRPLPKLYATDVSQEDTPWIFRFATPAGKEIQTAVWNGRRDYAHEPPDDIVRWVGGNRVAIVQVDSPVGVNRRSSLSLTHFLAQDFDGVIHWARDSDTFQSILQSFIRLDLESVSPPDIPEDWQPEVVILAANSAPSEDLKEEDR